MREEEDNFRLKGMASSESGNSAHRRSTYMLDILTASIETLDARIVHLKEENLENIEFDSDRL